MYRLIITTILILSVIAQAEMPLELIQAFHSDTQGSSLSAGCISPGDLDEDGFSEVFAGELEGSRRIFAFKGGASPDTLPDKMFECNSSRFHWFPDVNGDSIVDFGCRGPVIDGCYTIDIWFGGTDFYSKTEPELTFSSNCDSSYYFGYNVSAGDVNGDGQNDLIIADIQQNSSYAGKFHIFYGGASLDTIADDVLIVNGSEDGYNNFFVAAGLNDINGDGLADYAFTSFKGTDDISYVNIVFGDIPLDNTIDIRIATPFWGGWKPGTFGDHIYALGDINKDGYDDIAIGGNTTWPCIFYGGNPFDTIPKILGDTLDEFTKGDMIANIGDINHDGWADIGVGFESYALGSGIVYIYFGAYDMDSEADLVMPFSEAVPVISKDFGKYLGAAGDFNGDGVDDLVVSGRSIGLYDRGTVFVYAGDRTLPTPAEDESENPIPNRYNILEQNYPNPFNNQTIIEYELWGIFEREIELSIYNILGQNVRTLYQGVQSGGRHITYWDGKNDHSHPVSSGMYFYRLSSQNEIISKKMIYLK